METAEETPAAQITEEKKQEGEGNSEEDDDTATEVWHQY